MNLDKTNLELDLYEDQDSLIILLRILYVTFNHLYIIQILIILHILISSLRKGEAIGLELKIL